jgi:sporulation protein YlmC with PRC-barrel domain
MIKEDGKIVLDTTEEKMEKRTEFDYYREGLHPDYYYRPRYYRRYGYPSYPPPYLRSRPHGPQPSDRQIEPYPEQEPYNYWALSPARFLASSIIDRQMINEEGAHIGRVADLLIDSQDAKVKKIILATESIRNDDSYVAIPYEPPGITAYGIICDVSREEIKNLPAYEIDK